MGKPMAKHLMNAAYKLNVFNRSRQKADNLSETGAIWINTPADIAANSDIIVTMIGFPKDVEEVYLVSREYLMK